MRLKGKVALVTGAASGIGQATARLFARQGARTILCDVRTEDGAATAKEIEQSGGDAIFIATDVSDSIQVRTMVDSAIQGYGRIDVLVNAAAVLVYGTALETDEVCWQRVLATNLTGTFLCAKAVLPYMIRQSGGCIINFSSTAGAHDAIEHGVAYCASKGGVMALTKAMAVDHARENVRVNVICPGPTDTPMLRNALSPPELEQFTRTYPMRRLGQPEELAHAALFLASDEASFVTGSTMFVDGGQSALL